MDEDVVSDPAGRASASPAEAAGTLAPEERESLEARIADLAKQVKTMMSFELKLQQAQNDLDQQLTLFRKLHELGIAIAASDGVRDIAAKVCTFVTYSLGYERCIIVWDTTKQGRLTTLGSDGYWDEALDRTVAGLSLETSTDPLCRVIHDRDRVLHSDKEPIEEVAAFADLVGMIELVAVKLSASSGELSGVLVAGNSKEQRRFYRAVRSSDDVYGLANLCAQAASSIHASLLRSLEAEKDVLEMKTNFFANISHEFRTPVTLTLGPLRGILGGRYGDVGEDVKSQLDVMLRNQERLLNLVNQILDLSKLDAGGMKVRAARLPLNRFLTARRALFASMAEERGLTLREALDPALDDAETYFDPELLDKVIFNLLGNAHKFTKKGFIEVGSRKVGSSFEIVVSDSGVGIRDDQLSSLFQRFQQADGSASREYAGTGIGLSLVKEIVALHGGDARVESVYGQGSSFIVRLPLGKDHLPEGSVVANLELREPTAASALLGIQDEGADAGADAAAINEATEKNRRARLPDVLYVDDNPDLRRYVRDVLSDHANVFVAVDGHDGLEKIARYHPDLVLSDLMMPRMTGIELCREVRKDPTLRGLPFVLLTAKANVDSKLEGLEEGADDYLRKPFSEQELVIRVKNLIRLRRQQLRISEDLRAARDIQRAILPAPRFRSDRVALDAIFQPAEELSGDVYGYKLQEGRLDLWLADVTSHGVASAQVTYIVSALLLELLGDQGAGLLEVAQAFTKRFAELDLAFGAGLVLCRIDLATGAIDCVRGAAPPPIVVENGVRRPLAAEMVQSDNGGFSLESTKLAPGARLFLYTDGAHELPRKDGTRELGLRRLWQLLVDVANADDWQSVLLGSLAEQHGSTRFPDDLTLVRVVWNGALPQ